MLFLEFLFHWWGQLREFLGICKCACVDNSGHKLADLSLVCPALVLALCLTRPYRKWKGALRSLFLPEVQGTGTGVLVWRELEASLEKTQQIRDMR